MSQCICTGFALVSVEEGTWYPADLHKQDGALIVVTSGDGNSGQPHYERRAEFSILDDYFERRGIYVFKPHQLKMNEAMFDYVRTWL